MDVCHLFPQCLLVCYHLDRGLDQCCGDQSMPWILSLTSPLFCGCLCHVRVGSSPQLLEQTPPDLFLSCVSDLPCEVGRIGVLPLGEKPLSIPPLEFSPVSMLCCVTFYLLCELTSYSLVGIALGPTLTMGMLAVVPGVSQALFSPGHQCRSTEVRSQDQQLCTWTRCGSYGGNSDIWPNHHVYVPTKPAAAKARPISAAGVLVVHLDILQMLNLGSYRQRCNFVVCAAVRRNFSSSSLVTQPLGLNCGFSPTCNFYCSIVDSQCCVRFCCTAK